MATETIREQVSRIVPANASGNRKTVTVKNNGPNALLFGPTYEDATGFMAFRLDAGDSQEFTVDADVFGVAAPAIAAVNPPTNPSISGGITLTAAGTRNAVDLNAFGLDNLADIAVHVPVTAIAPNVDLVLQGSSDNTNWVDYQRITVTAIGTFMLRSPAGVVLRHARLRVENFTNAAPSITLGTTSLQVATRNRSTSTPAIPQECRLTIMTEFSLDI